MRTLLLLQPLIWRMRHTVPANRKTKWCGEAAKMSSWPFICLSHSLRWMSNKEVLRHHAEPFNPDVQLHIHWALDDITAAGQSLEEDDYISPHSREFNINEPVCNDRVSGGKLWRWESWSRCSPEAASGDDESLHITQRTWLEHLHNVSVCLCEYKQAYYTVTSSYTELQEVMKCDLPLSQGKANFIFTFTMFTGCSGEILQSMMRVN